MYINTALIDDFDGMLTVSNIDDERFGILFQLVKRAAELAVPSLLGWRVGQTVGGRKVTSTFARYPVNTFDVRASLYIPVTEVLSDAIDGDITLFAGRDGAFVDVATDIARALHLPLSRFPLDQDLEPRLMSGFTGLHAVSSTAGERRS